MKGVNNPVVLEPAFPGTEKRSYKPDTQFYPSNPPAHHPFAQCASAPAQVNCSVVVSMRPSLTQNPKIKEKLVGLEMKGGCPIEETPQLR